MIGVGIIGFNRPGYLRRLFKSIEEQADLSDVDFHLFLDGAVNPVSGVEYAKQKDIDASARVFARAKLPNKRLYLHDRNVGIGIINFEVTEFLAEHYSHCMQLEDDVVLSPHWFRLARILWREMEERPDVYSFSPAFRRAAPKGADAHYIDRVGYSWHHMWAECYTGDNWRKIRPEYMQYHTIIEHDDYLERDEGPVEELYRSKGMREDLARSQDGGREMAIRMNGMRRARLYVNRAIGIGQYGIHFTPDVFRMMGFEGQTPFIFDSDATREAFTWDD